MEDVKTVFIVDDDPAQTTMFQDYLTKFSWLTVKTFNTGEDCIKNLNQNPDIIFLDYNFDLVGKDALNGIEILNAIKGQCPDTEVVMVSAQDKIEVALNTMKYGAYDYVVKGESAFYRAENIILNIVDRMKLKTNAKVYKRFTYVFAVVIVAMIISMFILFNRTDDFHFYDNR